MDDRRSHAYPAMVGGCRRPRACANSTELFATQRRQPSSRIGCPRTPSWPLPATGRDSPTPMARRGSGRPRGCLAVAHACASNGRAACRLLGDSVRQGLSQVDLPVSAGNRSGPRRAHRARNLNALRRTRTRPIGFHTPLGASQIVGCGCLSALSARWSLWRVLRNAIDMMARAVRLISALSSC